MLTARLLSKLHRCSVLPSAGCCAGTGDVISLHLKDFKIPRVTPDTSNLMGPIWLPAPYKNVDTRPSQQAAVIHTVFHPFMVGPRDGAPSLAGRRN